MTIYEIDKAIEDLILGGIDEETGELLTDTDALEALQMERDRKVENLALAFKNLSAEAEAIRAEELNLQKRRATVEAQAKRAKEYLSYVLNGDPFKTPRVAVTYRKSQSVELDEHFMDWAKKNAPGLLKEQEPKADKRAIASALKDGVTVPHAELVSNVSMQIK